MSNSAGGGKKKKSKHGGRFAGDVWIQKKVEPRTLQAIAQKNKEWIAAHKDDTDEELIAYVHQRAKEIGRTPTPNDIVGGSFIERRFGTWDKVRRRANLQPPTYNPSLKGTKLYTQEFQRQAALFRREHSEKIKQKQLAAEAKRKELAAAATTAETANE